MANSDIEPKKKEIPGGKFKLLDPFKIRDFKLLWIGQAVSLTGDQFYFIALSWLVLDITDSATALGGVLLAAGIPRVIFMLLGGFMSDRFPSRIIMIYSNLLRLIFVSILSILVFKEITLLWHIYVLAIAFGFVDAFFHPAYMAMIPNVVGKDNLEPANAIIGATGQLTLFAGAPIAGIIIKLFGMATAFIIDSLTFVVSIITLLKMKSAKKLVDTSVPTVSTIQKPDVLGEIKEGLKFTWNIPLLRSMMLLSATLNFALGGPIVIGFPALIKYRIEGSTDALGYLFGSWGGAAMIAALIAGSFPVRKKRGVLLLSSGCIFGLCFVGYGYADDLISLMLISMAVGLTAGYTNVVNISWIQGMVDPKLLGRVMSLFMLFAVGLMPISHALTGYLIDWNLQFTFVAAGCLVLVATFLATITSNIRTSD